MVRLISALLLMCSYGALAEETPHAGPHQFYLVFVGEMNSLLDAVKLNQGFFSKNAEVLEELVGSHVNPFIDYEGISQFVVGKNWRWASKQEKRDFIIEFRRELIRTYAKSVLKQASKPVEWSYLYKSKKNNILVTAELGESKLGFYFRQKKQHNNKWMLYDIKMSSVSVTSTYRSTYRRVLQAPKRSSARKSIKELIRTIRRRNNARMK